MKKWIILLLALTISLSLAACGGGGTNKTPTAAPAADAAPADAPAEEAQEPVAADAAAKRVLRVGTSSASGGFMAWGENHNMIGNYLVYDRLFTRAGDGSYVTGCCESMEWLDGTTLLFHLKDGVYFSDGDRLVGEDVLYTLLMYATNGTQASFFTAIDFNASTVSEDGLDVYLRFSTEFGPFESLLGIVQIVNKSAVESMASDEPGWWDQPVGSGPYEVVENVDGSHTTYRLREDYWNRENVPAWDEIIVNYYTEQTAMFIAFENGELDLISSVSANDTARLQAGETSHPETTAFELVSTNSITCLCLSPEKQEFSDPKVREAIAHALDPESIGRVAYGALFKTADSALPETLSFYSSCGRYEYDTDYARQCMAESAYPDGFDVNVLGTNTPDQELMWEVVQAQLAEIGIRLSVTTADQATCIGNWMKAGSTDMMLMGTLGGNTFREPYVALSVTVSGPFPAARIADEEYIAHSNDATYTNDNAQRAENYEWIQHWLYDNCQFIPVVEDIVCYAYNSEVIGACDFDSGATPNLLFCYPAA